MKAFAPWYKKLITVCSKCYEASCWQGEFMCDESKTAGTLKLSIEALIARGTREHPSYWQTDEELQEQEQEQEQEK